ncbi:hypothetical protein MCOR12_008285 [Pyricularia oryzae]|nr:hypothetical protein MCOR12_008285 [Pyricularia oryzae]
MGEPEAILGKTHHENIKVVRDTIQPYLDAGREVALVAHSYGGFVATDAAAGHTVEDRREVGGRGGVKTVVYIVSPASGQKGIGLMASTNLVRGEHPAFTEGLVDVQGGVMSLTEESWKSLYRGVDEKLAKEAFAATSRYHSSASFMSETAAGARDLRAPLTYVIAGDDNFIISPAVQHRIADSLGPRCKKHALEGSGHAPWMQPELLPRFLDIIKGAVQG